jgi:hypothetical protein
VSDQSDALNALCRARGIISDPPEPLPFVLLPRNGVQLLDFAKKVGAIVGANGVFRREMTPVTIDPETGRIEGIEPDRWRTYVERHLVPCVERFGMKQPTTMNVAEARGCLACDDFRFPLRKLKRVHQARLPVSRNDGRIELLPKGYDSDSGFFTLKDCLEYSEDWTLERARFFLESLLSEFPFADARSRAAHVTAMVTMFAGAILPAGAKPLNFLYRANMPRSGKGLLAASAISGPWGAVQVQSIPGANEEFRKILDTEALNGSAYIMFDEVERKLVNRALNAFLTANVWTGRLMNSQQKFIVPQNSVVILAGNNVELSSDLAGRCLLVDLWVSEADAQARKIQHVISESWLSDKHVRADLLAAMWALVRAWDKAKRPPSSFLYRGFETFCSIAGGIVEYAGFGSPMKSTAAESDPDFADMLAIVEHMAKGVDRRWEFEFDALIDVCRELTAFECQLQGTWIRDGSTERFELMPRSRSFFGKLFSDQYGGTIFALADGRRVRFGKRGKNRQRRYTIEVVI